MSLCGTNKSINRRLRGFRGGCLLVIRPEQSKVLKLEFHKANLEPFVSHVTEYHAERTAEIGVDALPDFLGSAIERALEYDLVETSTICSFLDIVMTFGLDWSGSDLRWMHNQMADPATGDPPARLMRLRRLILYKLESSEATS
jgi:hypothetical protein